MKTVLWGVLALTLLDVALTSDVVTNLPVVLAGVAKWVKNWMDPTVPLISRTGVTTTTSTPPVTSTPPATTTAVSAPPPPGMLPPAASVSIVSL